MNISSYIHVMDKNKFALNMPEGTGLTAYLEKGEKGILRDMEMDVFERIASQLPRFPHLESVMFGGFGEPTSHPRILDMIRAVKALGLRAEMTTNATLLDYSPCHVCGGCQLLEKNEEDCYGNTFPACGGCLWAQGVIQCP